MIQKKFGLDIDGTVTHPATFIPYLNKHFNKNLTLDEITSYDLTKLLGVDHEQFWQWLIEHESVIYENALLADFVKDIISNWNQKHEIYYISARGTHLLDVTTNWFHSHQIPYHHIELIGKHDKIETVKNHKIDVFFEDKHDNACEIAEHCQIPVLLMDTPYNRLPIPDNVYRMANWKEANQWIADWLKRDS